MFGSPTVFANCPTGATTQSSVEHNVAKYYAAGSVLYLVDSWYDPGEDPDLAEPGDVTVQFSYGPGGGGGGGGGSLSGSGDLARISETSKGGATSGGKLGGENGLASCEAILEEVVAIGSVIGWGPVTVLIRRLSSGGGGFVATYRIKANEVLATVPGVSCSITGELRDQAVVAAIAPGGSVSVRPNRILVVDLGVGQVDKYRIIGVRRYIYPGLGGVEVMERGCP